MLVTYTEDGLRISCSEFGGLDQNHFDRMSYLVGKHFQVSDVSRGVKLLHLRTT